MPIIISSITRVASTNRIINQLGSDNETNRPFLLNAKTEFFAPASAASSCPSSAWFEFDLFNQRQNRNCIEFECHSQILLPDSPSGMDAATAHQTFIALQRARDQEKPNNNNNNNILRNNKNKANNNNNNSNMVSNVHRKITSVEGSNNDDDKAEDSDSELNGNMVLSKESRIKFRITENPMNIV